MEDSTARPCPASDRCRLWFQMLPSPVEKSRLAARDGIRAECTIPAPREDVFEFLADLENHWLITDRFVRVLSLEGPPGARTGGRVLLRAPLGLRRVATTQVEDSRPPAEMTGSADVGNGTRAEVRWSLLEQGSATGVTLAARLTSASRRDRVLWAIGGRAWMRRRLERALGGLASRFP